MKVSHIHFKVSNLDNSIEFYKSIFGLREKEWFGQDLVFMQDENCFDLALEKVEGISKLPNGVHFGFKMNSKEDLLKLFTKLGELHPSSLERNEINDRNTWASFVVFDPDQYPIEIYWDPSLN